MIQERSFWDRGVNLVLYTVLGLVTLSTLLPFIHVLAISLSKYNAVLAKTVGLWPIGLHFENYAYILLKDRQVLYSVKISLARVVLGVLLSLFLTVTGPYPLSRDNIYMPGRTLFKILLLFGLLFSGGLIPTFLSMRKLGLYNKFLVLILPGALNIFNTIFIMNFFRGIPSDLADAASIDGADHFQILFNIYLPLSLPSLATIALFSAVIHWNAWFDGILYLDRAESWPLQSYAYSRVISGTLAAVATEGGGGWTELTPEGMVAAFVLVTAIPIMLLYPLLQRYFVTGLTLGSVKG